MPILVSMECGDHVYTGGVFYCVQTNKFPTFLHYDTRLGLAWLELSEGAVNEYIRDGKEKTVEHCKKWCKKWGVQICDSMEEYEALLNKLGVRFCDQDKQSISNDELYISPDFQCDQTEGLEDFMCDGDCENCPISGTNCDGECFGCPCYAHCEDSGYPTAIGGKKR